MYDDDTRRADEAILTVLAATGPLSSMALAEKTGMALRRTQRRLRRLLAAGKVKKSGGRYVLTGGGQAAGRQEDHGPGGATGGQRWFWQDMSTDEKESSHVRQFSSGQNDHLKDMSTDEKESSHEVIEPEVVQPNCKMKEEPVRVYEPTFDILSSIWLRGWLDAGGNRQEGEKLSDQETRFFIAQNGLLGQNQISDKTKSDLYMFGFGAGQEARRQRLQAQKEAEQRRYAREQAIRMQKEQAALAKKQAEFQRQMDLLSALVKLIETQEENNNISLFEIYDILKEHGIPPTKWETWIDMATEVYRYKQQYSQKLEAYLGRLLHR